MPQEVTQAISTLKPKHVKHLYQRIADILRHDIKTNYASDHFLPPQRELAKRFDASYFTVGNAINELVKEGLVTRTVGSGTKVCNPSRSRRGLIGILTTTNDPIYLSEMFACTEAELRQARFRPIIYGGSHNYEDEEQAFHEIGSLNEAGVIIYSFYHDRFKQQVKDLLRRGTQCVAILRPINGIDCVRIDHRLVGMMQAQYVAERGWRKILYIGNDSVEYGRLQRDGFFVGMADAGLNPDDFLAQSVLESKDDTAEFAEKKIIEQISHFTDSALKNDLPEAVVVFGDRYLPPVCKVLRDHGLNPGNDVQLVGADNCNLPNLTYVSIDHQLGEIGKQAAHMLLDRIDGKYSGPPRLVTISPKRVRHL